MIKNQSGQILLLTLIMTGLGGVITGAMLGFLNGSSRGSGTFLDSTDAYYAAAGGIEAVMADLLEGDDALDLGYTVPSVTLNGIPVTISVAPPQVDLAPKAVYRYIDPGAGQGLASLAPGGMWTVILKGVEPFSSLFVNWAFIPEGNVHVDLRVLDGSGLEIAKGEQLGAADSPATLLARLGAGETYTLEFLNQDTVTVLSREFDSKGGLDRTWMLLKSVGSEYLITSTASGDTLRAYVRQIPGHGATNPPIKQTVVVESWQRPPPPPPTPTPGGPTLTPTPTSAPGPTATPIPAPTPTPVPTLTITLNPTDGWDEKNAVGLVASGKLAPIQSSDSDWWQVDTPGGIPGHFLSVQFDQTVPTGATIVSAKVYIEHWEDDGYQVNELTWEAGAGSVSNPTILGSTVPTVLNGEIAEAEVEWDITSFIDTAAKANDLNLKIVNNSTVGKKVNIDHAYVVVEYNP